LTDEVGDVDSEKITRREEPIDSLHRDVIGVAKVRQLPVQLLYGSIGSLPS
jgi:hypothetical protein